MKKFSAFVATSSLLLLAACGGSSDEASSADGGDKVSVVASFYPFAWVAEQVGGDLVDVQNLTSPGSEPHDLELAPKQVAALQDADLVVYEKHFQAAVDEAVEQAKRSDDDTVDADTVLTLLPTQEGAEEEHAEEGEHSEDEHADEESHDHGSEDPHTWLDPENMATMATAVADRLAAADPDNADTYQANADALTKKLTDLDTAFTTGLQTCDLRTIVTSHAAFQYLAKAYDLVQVPIAGVDPSNEPSAAQLADITKLVRAEGITTIFTEELVSPAIADTIAKEAGVTTATLDPIEGLSDQTKDQDYLSLMDKNLATLKKANSCS